MLEFGRSVRLVAELICSVLADFGLTRSGPRALCLSPVSVLWAHCSSDGLASDLALLHELLPPIIG